MTLSAISATAITAEEITASAVIAKPINDSGGGASGYAGAVLADSPTLLLSLDEAALSTTAVDLSGNGNNGTYTNTGNITYEQPGVLLDGSGDKSIRTNSNGLIQLPSGLNTSNKMSAECVIRWPTSVTAARYFFGNWNSSSTFQDWIIVATGASTIMAQIRNSANGITFLTSSYAITPGESIFVGLTIDELKNARIEVQGVADTAVLSATKKTTISGTNFVAANFSAGTGPLVNGDLSEAAYWNGTVLTPAQQAAHRAAAGI